MKPKRIPIPSDRRDYMTNHVREVIEGVRAMIWDLPGGCDTDANEEDSSPEDMTAWIGGIVCRRLDSILHPKSRAK